MQLRHSLVALFCFTLGCGDPDSDGDLFPASLDCDDDDRLVNPLADEVPYDGQDNDCDPNTPDDDLDRDGFTMSAGDCDDTNDGVYPGAPERCNALDNDCDGVVDNHAGQPFFADGDKDGYGDPSNSQRYCTQPEGFVDNSSDCDDTDERVHPDAEELCNQIDDDCDGITDNHATDAETYFIDYDGDGFGSDTFTLQVCDTPDPGWVSTQSDCDDTQNTTHPNALEVCDGLDNNCDGLIDEGDAAPILWFLDADKDGLGLDSSAISACLAPTDFYVGLGGDCDDTDPSILACP